jgi:hypothetical protein
MEEELRDDDRSSAQSTLASPANVFTSLRYSGKTQSLEEEAHRDSDLQVVAKDMCRLGPVTILDCLASWGTSSPRVGPPRAPQLRPARAPCDEVPHLELPPPSLPFDVLGESEESHSVGSLFFLDVIDDKQDSDSVSVETAQNCIIYDLEENDPYLSRGIKIFANVTIA